MKQRFRKSQAIMILSCVIFAFLISPAFASGECDIGEIPSPTELRARKLPLPSVAVLDSPTTGPPLREPDMVWVEDILSSMTLDEKIGQMIMPSAGSSSESMIDQYHIGGFIFVGNNRQASDLIETTNRLQNYSPCPLLFSIDSEAGLGARVADATIFPLIMAFGATGDPALTEACGHITARESRSLGIQIAFGPVVDVNTEPFNPIISTRSYSDDPYLVTRMARGFIAGARSEGLLCTFKHYPGHGDTYGDSHKDLPLVSATSETLQNVHIRPYRMLAGTGDIDLVMTAHVWYSAAYPTDPWPATLSPIFLSDILRTDIGYNGLVISDAYTMNGLALAVPDEEERSVVGVEAGLDIILMPPHVSTTFNGIKNAVTSGRLSESRIDDSVRRILIAKSRAGLPENKLVDPSIYPGVLRHPEHIAKVREVCGKAFTCYRNDLLTSPPLDRTDDVLVLALSARHRIFYRMSSTYFTDPLSGEIPGAVVETVSRSLDPSEHQAFLDQAKTVDKVVVAGYDWYEIASDDQVDLICDLATQETPVIYVSFGAPYHHIQIPGVDAFYCGYASVDAMQELAVEVLLGDREALGKPPVIVPGLEPPSRVKAWALY